MSQRTQDREKLICRGTRLWGRGQDNISISHVGGVHIRGSLLDRASIEVGGHQEITGSLVGGGTYIDAGVNGTTISYSLVCETKIEGTPGSLESSVVAASELQWGNRDPIARMIKVINLKGLPQTRCDSSGGSSWSARTEQWRKATAPDAGGYDLTSGLGDVDQNSGIKPKEVLEPYLVGDEAMKRMQENALVYDVRNLESMNIQEIRSKITWPLAKEHFRDLNACQDYKLLILPTGAVNVYARSNLLGRYVLASMTIYSHIFLHLQDRKFKSDQVHAENMLGKVEGLARMVPFFDAADSVVNKGELPEVESLILDGLTLVPGAAYVAASRKLATVAARIPRVLPARSGAMAARILVRGHRLIAIAGKGSAEVLALAKGAAIRMAMKSKSIRRMMIATTKAFAKIGRTKVGRAARLVSHCASAIGGLRASRSGLDDSFGGWKLGEAQAIASEGNKVDAACATFGIDELRIAQPGGKWRGLTEDKLKVYAEIVKKEMNRGLARKDLMLQVVALRPLKVESRGKSPTYAVKYFIVPSGYDSLKFKNWADVYANNSPGEWEYVYKKEDKGRKGAAGPVTFTLVRDSIDMVGLFYNLTGTTTIKLSDKVVNAQGSATCHYESNHELSAAKYQLGEKELGKKEKNTVTLTTRGFHQFVKTRAHMTMHAISTKDS